MILNSMAAVTAGGLYASPSYFKYNMNDTKTVNGQLLIVNPGPEDMNVVIDKKRLLRDNINLAFSDTGIANWITLNEPTNFVLKSGEQRTISFTVNAPSQFNYNDAVGAILVNGEPLQVGQAGNTTATAMANKQTIELIIPVIVGIAGPIVDSLQLSAHSAPIVLLSFMPGDFTYHVKNNGTVYANMTGNIEINGLIGSTKVPVDGGVFPEDDYYLSSKWIPGFADFGIYNAKTIINYGRYQQDQVLQTNDTILVIPVWLIFILLLGFAGWIVRKKEIKMPFKIKIEKK
ncbi:MAG: hypothetical protein ACXVHY_07020 [Methanobacterium sp.]